MKPTNVGGPVAKDAHRDTVALQCGELQSRSDRDRGARAHDGKRRQQPDRGIAEVHGATETTHAADFGDRGLHRGQPRDGSRAPGQRRVPDTCSRPRPSSASPYRGPPRPPLGLGRCASYRVSGPVRTGLEYDPRRDVSQSFGASAPTGSSGVPHDATPHLSHPRPWYPSCELLPPRGRRTVRRQQRIDLSEHVLG